MATALVTGGTSGIGAAFATALARDGHDLVLVARDDERLIAAAEGLRGRHGVRVETLRADLADRTEVQTVADRLADADRPVDLLVNNAGFGPHSRLTAADTGEHERAIDVMCRAVLILSAAAGRAMRERGHGRIVNVSSVAGYITLGGYSAVKSWVTVYSESLAVELRGSGVTVTAVCPGWVPTAFHERAGIRTSSIPRGLWIDADRVVSTALRDAARGRVLSVPTARFSAITWLLRHLPRAAVRGISAAISSDRHAESPARQPSGQAST